MWRYDKPEAGKRIVAIYNDGSGASLFATVEDGNGDIVLIDSDGVQHDVDFLTSGESYGEWTYLPDGTKLWCEHRSDEPLELAF